MPASYIEIFVEEPSLEAFLRVVVPQIIGEVPFDVYNLQSKPQLLEKLPARLKGYSNWLDPNAKIMVLLDRDGDDCKVLKAKLEAIAAASKLKTRSKRSKDGTYTIANRIIIEELEAWYFGDWNAAVAAYPRLPLTVPKRAGFRDPDAIAGGTWEAFERICKRAGYFSTGLRKIEAARAIAQYFNIAQNASASFVHFKAALVELAA